MRQGVKERPFQAQATVLPEVLYVEHVLESVLAIYLNACFDIFLALGL